MQNSALQVKNNRKQAKNSSAKLRKLQKEGEGSAKLGKMVVQNSVNKRRSFAPTKETLTKEIITKEITPPYIPPIEKSENEINQIIDIFYEKINPAINYKNLTIRKATEWFINKYGFDKTKSTCVYAISIQGEKYSPTITTPLELKNNLSKLIVYNKRKQNSKWKIVDINNL